MDIILNLLALFFGLFAMPFGLSVLYSLIFDHGELKGYIEEKSEPEDDLAFHFITGLILALAVGSFFTFAGFVSIMTSIKNLLH